MKKKLLKIPFPFKCFSFYARCYCPCCHHKTLDARGEYDICPVCFWEDSGTDNPKDYSGPNHMTLQEAQENYLKFGACDERAKKFVRPPRIKERAQNIQK